MTIAGIRLGVLAGLIMGSAPLAAQSSAAVPVSARGAAAIVDQFHAALHRGDAKGAAALLAGDAVIFEEGGVERSKAEYARQHLPADAVFSQAVPSVVTRRTGASVASMAWIASEGTMTGTYKGKVINRVTTETMVLRRAGQGWRIVHIHWSSAATP